MPNCTRRLFMASLTCTPLALSESWEEPAFPAWSGEFIDRILTDSPWAKQSNVKVEIDPAQRMQPKSFAQIGWPGGGGIGLPRTGGGSIPGVGWPGGGGSRTPGSSPWPGGGGPTKAEIFLTTRWASALPVRRARALQQYGAHGLQHEDAVALLTAKQTEYVVEIAGFNVSAIRQGAKKFAADLSKTARIVVPGRRPLSANDAQAPEHGMHLMVTLRFPRFENLEAKEGHIEVIAETRGIALRERFKLKELIYAGSLEL
jgi:hypothetical protein